MTVVMPDARPVFHVEQIQAFIEQDYALSGDIQEMSGHIDQNFLLITETEKYVIKVANGEEPIDDLRLQNAMMTHLANFDLSATFTQVIKAQSDDDIVMVEDEDGNAFAVRVVTYLDGMPLMDVKPHDKVLLKRLGRFIGEMSNALETMAYDNKRDTIRWNLKNASNVIASYAPSITNESQRQQVLAIRERFETHTRDALANLPQGFLHNDANDSNVMVQIDDYGKVDIVGLIDFGDMAHGATVIDLGVCLTYVMMNRLDPLHATRHVIQGYCDVRDLSDDEVACLLDIIKLRLAVSVSISAYHRAQEPDNVHMSLHEKQAWDLLTQLNTMSERFVHYFFRDASGKEASPQSTRIQQWLRDNQSSFARVVDFDVKTQADIVFDLSVSSLDIGDLALLDDREWFHEHIFGRMAKVGREISIGRYDEARLIYQADFFKVDTDEFPERRTVHIGLDIFAKAGTPIYAPIDGEIIIMQDNAGWQDYGPMVILKHDTGEDVFYTLYGHLARGFVDGLQVGDYVMAGTMIARMGEWEVNGNWPPHLHLQIMVDMLDYKDTFPGVVRSTERSIWRNLCPNPNLILGIPDEFSPDLPMSKDKILDKRHQHIAPILSIAYEENIQMVRGYETTLYDENGQGYLDAVNNVPTVGHSNPQVVEAGQRQLAVLNTNTRYLHENLIEYAERITATLPDGLDVCVFVSSGSEANELALRMAQTITNARDMIVVDHAYHGHTSSLIDLSPYKHNGKGGYGTPDWVHVAEMPDLFRGQYRYGDKDAGERYAEDVARIIEKLKEDGRSIAGFIAESIQGCGGQLPFPDGYLQAVYQLVRDAGGVCIADEVQVGLGRVGNDKWWAFELGGVVPDIVTMGKPLGNGHPLAAVVTTREIADKFDNGMEYFATFGGNPVSCAIGLAVLNEIEVHDLRGNATRIGHILMDGFRELAKSYPIIGDVRGSGLFIGVELVTDYANRTPAGNQAEYIKERLKAHGILISTEGPYYNVLKIKPPLVFSETDSQRLLTTTEKILQDTYLQI